MTFSTAVRKGIRCNCGKINPIFSARTRFSPVAEIPATFSPSSQISPDEGRSRQPIKFTRVDFPDRAGHVLVRRLPGFLRRVEFSDIFDLDHFTLPSESPRAATGAAARLGGSPTPALPPCYQSEPPAAR